VIYNNSGDTVKVWGGHCPACFAATLAPGASVSCPGDKLGCRGDTTISYNIPSKDDYLGPLIDPNQGLFDQKKFCYVATPNVTNHGWVVITGSGVDDPGDRKYLESDAAVYDNNGNQLNAGQTAILPTVYSYGCP